VRPHTLLLVAVLLLAWASFSASARADGDPASDALATQSLFLPQDAGAPAAEQRQLQALLEEARSEGAPIRLAVIASPADLGSVTALWRQPESYSRFLGQELSLVYRGLLLVLMPNGYGVFSQAGLSGAQQASLARAGTPNGRLGAAALQAVERLAAVSGHPLPVPSATSREVAGSSHPISWIVFALGAALIGIAWTASLRARPWAANVPPRR
jgi:hypothetical protein